MKQYKEKVVRIRVMCVLCLLLAAVLIAMKSSAVVAAADKAGDMAVYSGVTVSPDGTAWTTDYMDRTNESLPEGYTISTGQVSGLRVLNEGEHYYQAPAEGSVRIGKWVVAWKNAQCIHTFEAMNYRGFQTNAGICENYYNNGWNAYCADCNELVTDLFFYAKSETIKGILSMPAESCYLFICPHCEGLEQGSSYQHICRKISYNHYTVSYEKNAPINADVNGYMSITRHMYNNAAIFEGMEAKKIGYGDTRLRKNAYTAVGYAFIGWNTTPDGSGAWFQDGQEVINLTDENNGDVVLYAQWEKVESTLNINPSGGTYEGKAGVTSISGVYGETYFVDSSKLIPSQGHLVTFEANGGSCMGSLQTEKSFFAWQKGDNFQGLFEDDTYTYLADSGHTDTITAVYQDVPFALPAATKEGYAFAGWYEDEACTEFVGRAGDEFTASRDITLYARWSQLVLEATDNYQVYGGFGAVNLSWSQPDETEKYYKLYQSRNKSDWTMIYDADTITNSVTNVSERIDYNSQVKTYVVQRAGYYTLSAYGAKGGDYGSYSGGAGGYTTATYWLKRNDIITIYGGTAGNVMSGGVNGSIANGGASLSSDGAGGGAGTEIYITRNGVKELLLIAGGGGGANRSYAGGAGGSSLTAVSSSSGTGSKFGGGGGGAQGGASNGSSIVTTIDNPATEDIAFMSHVSKTYRNYANHAIAGYMENNRTGYPIYQTGIYGRAPWGSEAVQHIGSLNRAISITETEHSSDEEYHYKTSTNSYAVVGQAPEHYCLQAGEGFVRTFTATYPTNGNTNLVLSASQQTSWHAGNGYIQFIITNADTGAVIHSRRVVEANAKYAEDYDDDGEITASGSHLYVGCWADFTIPAGVKNVTVTVKIFISAWDAHAYAYFTDVFFYGKEIVTIGPTTGGTSYINTGYGCKNQAYSGGGNNGAGYGTITGKMEAFLEQTSLEGVKATDTAAPDVVILQEDCIKMLDTNKVKVTWIKPRDNGTVYYHKCESYSRDTKQLESNITKNTLVSGVKGYYYYIDTFDTGTVTKSHVYVEMAGAEGSVEVLLKEEVQYLHVAAVDVAGNLSGTATIALGNEDGPQYPADDSYPENAKLFTEKLTLEDTEFTHQGEESIWFVKADGVTEHILHVGASMDKAATFDFQINTLRINAENETSQGWMQVTIPHGDTALSSEAFLNDSLSIQVSGEAEALLRPGIFMGERLNHAVQVKVSQNFTVNSDTSAFYLYPQAIAEFKGKAYCSEEARDVQNGLTIIPDGEAPEIYGLEELQNLRILDITEQAKQVTLWAKDTISGLQEFTVFVRNKDNHMQAEFSCDSEGKVMVEINKENSLFVGEVAISAVASDRVCNAKVVGEEGLSFTLETNLYKERNPEEHIFKTGDGAVLDIFTSGYVERIEVIFPEELLGVEPDLNCVFEYERPALRQKECLKFSIPLGIAEQEYEVIVKAFKNGEVLISKPTFVVVEGTVLDELRTRIRNNGQFDF